MTERQTAVIVDAVRTARGKKKGSLIGIHPMDLLAHTLNAAVQRTGIDPLVIDDVVIGCVTQVGEQGLNIARGAVLAAGLPIDIAASTVNRFCGSGLQAVNFAAMQIMSGQAQLAIGGGVESMNRVPMGSDAIGPGDGPASPALLTRSAPAEPSSLPPSSTSSSAATCAVRQSPSASDMAWASRPSSTGRSSDVLR